MSYKMYEQEGAANIRSVHNDLMGHDNHLERGTGGIRDGSCGPHCHTDPSPPCPVEKKGAGSCH